MPFHSRNDLQVRTRDGRNVALCEPLEFVTASGRRFRVPAGAVSDGASVPPALWLKLPPFGDYWLAAVLHDAAYRGTLEEFSGVWSLANLSKDECDGLFLEAMTSLSVNEETRTALYEGVHLLGWKAFAEDRKTQTA